MDSSAVRVLVALVKAERKRAAALENVSELLKKRKEQSGALFTQAKEEMEEARNKLAEAEQARRQYKISFIIARFKCLSSQHACCDVRASTDVAQNVFWVM